MLNWTVTLATKTDMDMKVRPLYDTPRRFYHTHRHAVDVAYGAMHISRQMRFTADERMEYLPERVADVLWVAGMWQLRRWSDGLCHCAQRWCYYDW